MSVRYGGAGRLLPTPDSFMEGRAEPLQAAYGDTSLLLAARQHRSLSESCAYQIPECSRRGILKNGRDWRRTISESSDDFPYTLSLDSELSYPASSLDSIQPKKTVSFNDQISHIIYRANSSILARRRRNQKKAANKKKAAARRALSRSDSTDTSGVSSGSEASLEDVSQLCVQTRFEDSSKADQVVV